jgi:hypothetical protein
MIYSRARLVRETAGGVVQKGHAGRSAAPAVRSWMGPARPEAIPVHAGGIVDDPAQQGGDGTGALAPDNAQGAQPQQGQVGTPKAGKVSAVTLIDSPTGALSGFPSLAGVPDLNTPGPFNDTTTGACQNVQQIRFDLNGITPNEVDLFRKKDGVAGPVGQEQPRKGPDGPSDPTKLRKDKEGLIAVADTPGISKANAGFPLRYTLNFELYAFDVVSKGILAKVTYSVNIVKQAVNDAKPVNELKNFQATKY